MLALELFFIALLGLSTLDELAELSDVDLEFIAQVTQRVDLT